MVFSKLFPYKEKGLLSIATSLISKKSIVSSYPDKKNFEKRSIIIVDNLILQLKQQ